MIGFLAKDRLFDLLKKLARRMEIIAPIKTESGPVYSTWTGQPLDLESNPQIPPTEFLLPQRDVLFKYIQYSGRYSFEKIRPKSRIIMGVRPCDLKAIKVLDRIFGAEPRDSTYFARRSSTILAALNCQRPLESCFCSELGSGPECNDGFDLLMTELDSGYLVESGSPAGLSILEDFAEFFEEPNPSQLKEKNQLMEEARSLMKRSPRRSLEDIKLALEKADWEALGKRCLSCGGCSFVCPVCHCFNILDLGVPDGDRMRCRDSCILSGFTRMTSGVNPRIASGQRLKNWYLDKFQYIPQNTGLLGCVGCGRCSQVCPAEIDRWKMKVLI